MKKITDILKKPTSEDKVILDVLVKNGKLVLLTDSLLDGFEKGCEKFNFELTKPNYDVLALACASLHNAGGQYDPVGAGKIIFDACYLGNQGTLEELKQLPELYVGLCAKCSDEAELAYVDYKKK